ncbi:MAG: HEAT repeat domain-containing protein [Planctomycetota bacterium]
MSRWAGALCVAMLMAGTVAAGESAPVGGQAERIERLCQEMGETQYGRKGACEQLIAIGEPAVPALIKTLDDKRPQARWWAVAALCNIGTDEAFPAVVKTLRKDPNAFVRSTAVYHLRHFRKQGKDIWPVVRQAIEDKSPEVGRWALRLMVEDGYPQVEQVLRDILADAAPDLQSYALMHVREIAERDGETAGAFLPLVKKLLKAEDKRLRYDAVHTHVVLMKDGKLAFLRETYENADSPVEQEAAMRCATIMATPPVEIIELFLMGLDSKDEKVREAAATLLRKGCKQYFGYDARMPLERRRHHMDQWIQWYRRNRDKLQWHPDLRKFLLPGVRDKKPATATAPDAP